MASKDLEPLPDSSFKLFVKSQFCVKAKPPPPTTSFEGKTALITGSNIGIGLECARQFLDLKLSHLILAVRSVDKGEQAAALLRKAHSKATIEVWQLDMLSYDSIQAFANRCIESLPSLDIAILNAGITQLEFKINKSTEHEEMFQVNYLSSALLAILLIPVLKSKGPNQPAGRLSIVSSGTGLISKFANHSTIPLIPSFDDSQGWDLNAANERYCVSKTLLFMLVYKLSDKIPAEDVIINVVDPGMVGGSHLHRNLHGPVKAILSTMKKFSARSLEEGAWTYVDAAVVKGEESHGCFLMVWKIAPYHALMYTDDGKSATNRLWDETLNEPSFTRAKGIISSVA